MYFFSHWNLYIFLNFFSFYMLFNFICFSSIFFFFFIFVPLLSFIHIFIYLNFLFLSLILFCFFFPDFSPNYLFNPNITLFFFLTISPQHTLLATKSVGALITTKRGQELWLDVQNSENWDLNEGKDGILPALKTSYDHLLPHLKWCLLFPKILNFQGLNWFSSV